ncbi:MAG: malate synthase A [Elusimicrobia bacterium]|nr:malate synthase A [Elusimicrobiota bacterium]
MGTKAADKKSSPLDLSRHLNRILKSEGIEVLGRIPSEVAHILSPEAVRFVGKLQRRFSINRELLLQKREERQAEIDEGKMPDFLPQTKELRLDSWTVGSIPKDLEDRRVEITGPVDRKMIINALNSGAKVYMADFEDSHAPGWEATLQGQANLWDAVRRKIEYVNPEGKAYILNKEIATLLVRPRGWHLLEKHVHVEGKPISASLFDFGLFFFHNAKALIEKGTAPYFYLPKMESHLEARLWNDVFVMAEQELEIPRGTIRATVLIETILAAFEMDEILFELREHSAGLNCGRWDYIFSFIKKFRNHPKYVLPDRSLVTMTTHFLRSYSRLLVQVCHRRGIHAMGGMAAQIPIKNDPVSNEAAMAKVLADKEREVSDGHDGTWVAHPGLVPIAAKVFDAKMPQPNQIQTAQPHVSIMAQDLLQVPAGDKTEEGLRVNIRVGVQYLENWLRGVGCVPLDHLMEDAATAEISRAQVWQWIRHRVMLKDGRSVTTSLFHSLLKEEMEKIKATLGNGSYVSGKYSLASDLFSQMVTAQEFAPFLTLPAYEYLD